MPVVGPPMGPPQMGGYPPQFAPHPGQHPQGPPMGGNEPQAMMESAHKRQDFEALCHIINQWNANRLDLFALTLPNEVRTLQKILLYSSFCMCEGRAGILRCIFYNSCKSRGHDHSSKLSLIFVTFDTIVRKIPKNLLIFGNFSPTLHKRHLSQFETYLLRFLTKKLKTLKVLKLSLTTFKRVVMRSELSFILFFIGLNSLFTVG